MAGLGGFCPLRTWLAEAGVHKPSVNPRWIESEDVEMLPTPEWAREVIWRVDRWGDEREDTRISAGELRRLLC